MPDDRKAEPETARPPCRDGVRLSETVEDERQEVRRDATAGILIDELHIIVSTKEAHIDPAARRSELDGGTQKVPRDLVHPVGITRDRPGAGVQFCMHSNPL